MHLASIHQPNCIKFFADHFWKWVRDGLVSLFQLGACDKWWAHVAACLQSTFLQLTIWGKWKPASCWWSISCKALLNSWASSCAVTTELSLPALRIPPSVRICPLVPTCQTVWDYQWLTVVSHGEQHSKNTRAWYSSGIGSKYKKMKYKFEYKYGLRSNLRAPNLKDFSARACLQTPLAWVCLNTHQPPPPLPQPQEPSISLYWFVLWQVIHCLDTAGNKKLSTELNWSYNSKFSNSCQATEQLFWQAVAMSYRMHLSTVIKSEPNLKASRALATCFKKPFHTACKVLWFTDYSY